jgi:hypothetical protein
LRTTFKSAQTSRKRVVWWEKSVVLYNIGKKRGEWRRIHDGRNKSQTKIV